ncbi:hypothetical protein N7474_011106 [Penicillium riverlandense]|uniref:uncharacterized protein n=1 Tax=Penicillium riverlandense TaxID=1903569 RepID=UPI002547F3AE|nr:uncharacterized protein N7474_011106 [Penicillium riverlandense]KAJ5805219.1 hypothetical protein N7474_011106 [Penicillium riverlandense]
MVILHPPSDRRGSKIAAPGGGVGSLLRNKQPYDPISPGLTITSNQTYDLVIVTSGPSATYPQRAYRNPLDALVHFLDSKHGSDWCIWEFRAEGTGYPDSEVYGRIHHFPWPDHHPPPFALIPNIMGSMRNWLQEKEGRVAVVHCKAGKGRSGSIASGYLISQEGWTKEDALQRFTERRMRTGFGAGVSIPSQLRYVGYIERWTNELQKEYVERPVEILEVHIWGLRDGVKVAVEGYVDEGKKIKILHMFHRSERTIVEDGDTSQSEGSDKIKKSASESQSATPVTSTPTSSTSNILRSATTFSQNQHPSTMIFRPKKPLIVPTSDINIDFERRSKASYTGFTMVTSIAHVWFNAYFEGGAQYDSGVFETEWDAMDGIKGSAQKGIRAMDRLKVVWRYPPPSAQDQTARPISEPKPGEPISETHPADWRGYTFHSPAITAEQENEQSSTGSKTETNSETHTSTSTSSGTPASAAAHLLSVAGLEKDLGLRKQTDESKDVSLAGSEDERSEQKHTSTSSADLEGVRSYFEKTGPDEQKRDGEEGRP